MPPTHLKPSAKPRSGRYLTFQEREDIALELAKDTGIRAIARKLGRSPNSLSREVRRKASTRGGAPGAVPRPAARPLPAWRKLDSRLDLTYIFSLRYERVVSKGHVISAIPGVTISTAASGQRSRLRVEEG